MILLPLQHPVPKLSEELASLRQRYANRSVTFQELIYILKARGYTVLLILLALPFTTPIPLPGLSTPLGLVIAIIGLRLVMGKRPWLPRRLRKKEIPSGFFDKLILISARVVSFLEKFLRPRWLFFFSKTSFLRVHALLIFLAACILLLPLPVPFSNAFPAWVVIFIAGGLLERDGVSVLLGYLVFIFGVLFFVFLGEAAQHLLSQAWLWLGW